MIDQYCIKHRNAFNIEDWRYFQFSQWEKLPLQERITLVRERRVKFFDAEGEEIPPNQAVKSML